MHREDACRGGLRRKPADIVTLDSLVSRIVDGVQTADDERALAELLAHDAEALRRYRRLMAVRTSLHLAYASVAAQSAIVPRSSDRVMKPDRKRGIGRAAAAAILVAGLGIGLIATMGVVSFRDNPAVEQAAAAWSESPLATVARTRFVAARATGEPLVAGQPLGGFPRRLEAGEAARFAPGADRDAVILPYDGDRFIRRLPKDRGIEHRVPASPNDSAVRWELERQFGRPEHESLIVSRPRGPVVVAGQLDEWAEVPGFRAWLGGDHTAAESVDGRMMYGERLSIAARVADPAPLLSRINPALDPNDGWRGGAIQVRLSTDRSLGWPVYANAPNYYRMRGLQPGVADKQAATNPQLAHLTMWYHAASRQPCLTIRHGMMTGEIRDNPSGFEGAFAKTADGLGYTVEYAIPWRLLNYDRDPPQPGDALGVSWQVHFSDDDGRLWRTQILDVRNSDELPRSYTWERAATWGRAEYR